MAISILLTLCYIGFAGQITLREQMSDNAQLKHLAPNEQWAIRQMAVQSALQARQPGDTIQSVLENALQFIDFYMNGGRDVQIQDAKLPDAPTETQSSLIAA